MRKQPAFYSVCVHVAFVIALLVTATFSHYATSKLASTTTLLESKPPQLYAPKLRMLDEGGSIGGGRMSPLPPNKGEIPRVAKVFLPPMLPPREAPRIVLPSGVEDAPQIMAEMPMGIPTGLTGTNSQGPGRGGNFGKDGCCGGTESGNTGQGGDKGKGGYAGKRPSIMPQLLWKTEPEYSEEARKARHQGSVMLALEIDQDGKPRNIRVVRSLGLGLDERAVEAVSQWRFKPGLLNGRPVNSPVSVEVSFRLL